MIALQLTNAIGVQLSVALNSEDDLLDAMRHWGRKRWRTIALPYGGLYFPLAMADTFDWSIIGAQPGEQKNSKDKLVQGVWFENRFYTRRHLAANPNKDMDEAVKYSRGASQIDRDNPNVRVEEGTGENEAYVTLVVFKGTGKVLREYERPQTQAPQAKQPDPDPKPVVQPAAELPPHQLPTAAESGLKGEELADAIARGLVAPPANPNDTVDAGVIRAIEAAAAQVGLDDQQLVDLSIRTIKTPAWRQTTVGNARALFAAIAHHPRSSAA